MKHSCASPLSRAMPPPPAAGLRSPPTSSVLARVHPGPVPASPCRGKGLVKKQFYLVGRYIFPI